MPKYNLLPVVITGRTSEIVQKRCDELEIMHFYQGVKDKVACLTEWLQKQQLSLEKIAYIGDDNDLFAMSKSGVVGYPNHSSESVKSIAQFISTKSGGNGAAREFIDWLVTNGYFIQTS